MTEYKVFTEKEFKQRVQLCIDMFFKEEGLTQANIPIEISKQMSSTLGQFQVRGGQPHQLRFSNTLVNGSYMLADVDEVIKHEVIHYLLKVKTGMRHGHDMMFKMHCRHFNCSHDGSRNHMTKSPLYSQGFKYTIKCDNCGAEIGFNKNTKTVQRTRFGYISCKCGGKYHVVGEV